jgi:hypothetical protein
MMNRIKALPQAAIVLFALVLSIEIFSFLMTMQASAIVRLVLLAVLFFLTIGGSRIARAILVFLLIAGSIFVLLASSKSHLEFWERVSLLYAPAALLLATASYIVLSKEFKNVCAGKVQRAEIG